MSSSSSSSDDFAAAEETPAIPEPTAEEEKTPATEKEEEEKNPATEKEEEETPAAPAVELPPATKSSSRATGSGPVVRFDISPNTSTTAIAQTAIDSLKSILPNPPSYPTTTPNLALALLHDPSTTAQITNLLLRPTSGSGDDNLCRWLYDTFQSNNPDLKLVVLRFLPTLLNTYLSRVVSRRKSLAGFEAVLLALYAHETNRRASQPLTVNIPDLAHPSIYHESDSAIKYNATALNLALISPSLEPHGMVRSTKRARILGVALELYYTKIEKIPESSKIDFCEFCRIWAGGSPDREVGKADLGDLEEEEEEESVVGRIPLPWEILQPVLRVLGHCLLGSDLLIAGNKCRKMSETTVLFDAAIAASRSLYVRSMHDINPKAILATGSLVRLGNMALEAGDEIDYTEIPVQTVITL